MQNTERALQVIADEIVRAGHSYERKTCINAHAYVFAVSSEGAHQFQMFVSGLEIFRNCEDGLRALVRSRIGNSGVSMYSKFGWSWGCWLHRGEPCDGPVLQQSDYTYVELPPQFDDSVTQAAGGV